MFLFLTQNNDYYNVKKDEIMKVAHRDGEWHLWPKDHPEHTIKVDVTADYNVLRLISPPSGYRGAPINIDFLG